MSRSRASSSSRWTLATSPASEPTKTRLKTSTDDRRMIERRCARPIVEQTCCRSLPVALLIRRFRPPVPLSCADCSLTLSFKLEKMCLRFRATHTQREKRVYTFVKKKKRGDARARGFQREYKTNTQTRKESETVNAVFDLPTRERRFVMTDCVTSYYYVSLVTRILSTSTFTLKLERFVNNHPP